MIKPITPLLAVDIIAEYWGRGDTNMGITFVERKNEPKGIALPGGFVDVGETVIDAAKREFKEETGLMLDGIKLAGIYSRPDRDPRQHVVSIVFIGTALGAFAKAGSDAKEVIFLDSKEIKHRLKNLAFDHSEIVLDYFINRASPKPQIIIQ